MLPKIHNVQPILKYPKPRNTSARFPPHSPMSWRKTSWRHVIVSGTTPSTRFDWLWHKGRFTSSTIIIRSAVLRRFWNRYWSSAKASWQRWIRAFHCLLLHKSFQTSSQYAITEPECLPIVSAVDKSHCYLHGDKFRIVTDHAALQWLKTIKTQQDACSDGRTSCSCTIRRLSTFEERTTPKLVLLHDPQPLPSGQRRFQQQFEISY